MGLPRFGRPELNDALTVKQVRHNAIRTYSWLVGIGLALSVLGGIVVGASWSSDSVQYSPLTDSLVTETRVDTAGVTVGLAFLGLGALFLIPGLVALGVRLGVEAADRRRSA